MNNALKRRSPNHTHSCDGACRRIQVNIASLPEFWATRGEVEGTFRGLRDKEELVILRQPLRRETNLSLPRNVFLEWDLHRQRARDMLARFANDRTLQATFGNLVGATLLKPLGNNMLMCAKCPAR